MMTSSNLLAALFLTAVLGVSPANAKETVAKPSERTPEAKAQGTKNRRECVAGKAAETTPCPKNPLRK